jgi:hypothetical protein
LNPNDVMTLIFLIIFFLIGGYSAYSGFRNFQFAQKIKNTAISKVGSVAIGLVGISGQASSDDPEPSPISGTPSVCWKITGEYLTSGKSACWVQIHAAKSTKRFYIQDDTGRIPVNPMGARMDLTVSKYEGSIAENEDFSQSSSQKMDERVMQYISSLDFDNKVAFRDHGHRPIRIFEYCIANHGPLYVMGSAEPVRDISGAGPDKALEIRKDENDGILYINTSGERQAIKEASSWIYLKIFGGIALCSAALFGISLLPDLSERDANFFAATIVLFVIAGVAIWYTKKVWNGIS